MRERATEVLADRTGSLAAAALAVRSVDHVAEVREVAWRALDNRREIEDADAIVPILLAARRRKIAVRVADRYIKDLSSQALRSLTSSRDTETRRVSVERAPLGTGELVQIAASDGDMGTRLAAARRAISRNEASARDLLETRPATVRALAVTAGARSLVRPRVEKLLLDRSALVRRAARTRAREFDIDPASFYRSRLPKRAAVLGLGEVGNRADADRIASLVTEGPTPAVRRAAVRALGRLGSRKLLMQLLPPLLEADQPGLVRTAGRQLRRIGFDLAGVPLARALSSPHVWTRHAALNIAFGRPGWQVPVAALALYDDEDERLRMSARSGLTQWLARKAPAAGRPTSEQADRLRASLTSLTLSPELERLVRFHAHL
jgi:hypothetical protein